MFFKGKEKDYFYLRCHFSEEWLHLLLLIKRLLSFKVIYIHLFKLIQMSKGIEFKSLYPEASLYRFKSSVKVSRTISLFSSENG